MVADAELQGRLMGMGLFIGTRFQLLRSGTIASNIPFLLAIGETRIAVDHNIAGTILVEA
jgi:Fe2+ transport system protein FeoA